MTRFARNFKPTFSGKIARTTIDLFVCSDKDTSVSLRVLMESRLFWSAYVDRNQGSRSQSHTTAFALSAPGKVSLHTEVCTLSTLIYLLLLVQVMRFFD